MGSCLGDAVSSCGWKRPAHIRRRRDLWLTGEPSGSYDERTINGLLCYNTTNITYKHYVIIKYNIIITFPGQGLQVYLGGDVVNASEQDSQRRTRKSLVLAVWVEMVTLKVSLEYNLHLRVKFDLLGL